MSGISVIIVTHNSAKVIGRCLDALARQQYPPGEIVLVDSGSDDPSYLEQYSGHERIRLLFLQENVGFARANNIGYGQCAGDSEYVLYLNPDAFLQKTTLKLSRQCLIENQNCGVVGGRLLGWDLEAGKASGLLDSTGIFRKWYGRWVDRGQGERDHGQFLRQESVPALCGAFLFCRRSALERIRLAEGVFFDPDFFLYKEDIELSIRMRKYGYGLLYNPDIRVFHCRGWQARKEMEFKQRLLAAKSELLLYRKHPSPYICWALFKYLLVRCLRL